MRFPSGSKESGERLFMDECIAVNILNLFRGLFVFDWNDLLTGVWMIELNVRNDVNVAMSILGWSKHLSCGCFFSFLSSMRMPRM